MRILIFLIDFFLKKIYLLKFNFKKVKAEKRSLAELLRSFPDNKNKNEEENGLKLTPHDFITKMLNYIEFWRQNKGLKSHVNYILDVFSYVLQENNKEKLFKIQNQFNDLNAFKIIVDLFIEEEDHFSDIDYTINLIKFLVLFTKQNKNVLKKAYDFFRSNSLSQHFFNNAYEIIKRFIEGLIVGKIFEKKTSKLLFYVLKLLKNLTFNHDIDLQNYLKYQYNSKTNFDIVDIIVKLIISIEFKSEYMEMLLQTLKTLTSFIQGPCVINQNFVINSKFLPYSLQIINVNIFF